MPTTVDQIMTRKLLTIASDASLEDAAWGLSLKRVQGSPVKDDSGRVIGILSRNDVGVIARLPGARELGADVRAQRDQLQVVPAVERQFNDAPVLDDGADRRVRRFDERRHTGDGDSSRP